MIKYVFLLILTTFVSAKAFCADTIVLNSVEEHIIHEENVIDYVVGSPGMLIVKRNAGDFTLIPVIQASKTYIIFLKTDGSSKSYIIDIVSNRVSTANSKSGKTFSGIVRGRTSFTDQKTTGNPYSLSFLGSLKTSENTRVTVMGDHYDDAETSDTEITSVALEYKNRYLLWSRMTEKYAQVPYYLTTNFRGYTLGQKDQNTDFGVWFAHPYENRIEDGSRSAQGAFISNTYFEVPYQFAIINAEDRYIPFLSLTFPTYSVVNSFGISFLDDKYLFRYSGVKAFHQNTENFNLRAITGYYETAPNGSYGLYNENNDSRQDYGGSFIFANQDSIGIDQQNLEKDIDFIPGIISSSIGYDKSIYDATFSDRYHLFLGYGFFDKVTFSGFANYSTTDNFGLKSEQFVYSPRLSLFIHGNKYDGYSLRNEYTSTVDKNFLGNISQGYRNTIGLYRNKRKYYYGVYVGAADYDNGTSTNNSKIYGANFSYAFQDGLGARIGVERTVSETGSYSNGVSLEGNYVYKKDLSVYARLNYKQNHDEVRSLDQSGAIGTVGFTWNFGFGEGDVYSKLVDHSTNFKGHVYNDLNFNGQQDANEPVINDLEITSIKSGQSSARTDAQGNFRINDFSNKEMAVLNVNDVKYSPTKELGFMMSKNVESDIGVYESVPKKVVVIDQKGERLPLSNITFSCEKNGLSMKKELYTDYSLVYFPKNVQCIVEIAQNDETSALIDKTEEKNGILTVQETIFPKIMAFEYVTKIRRPFYLNNKLISPKSSQVVENIEYFKGILSIKLHPKCTIDPTGYEIPYNNLKKQNFYKISCF